MFFISQAQAQETAAQAPPGGEMFSLFLLAGMFIFFYFIAIRPQRKRQKEHEELINNLAKGDEVITSSGMLGKITGLEDHYVVLNVANNVDIKFQRVTIQAVLPKGTIKQING